MGTFPSFSQIKSFPQPVEAIKDIGGKLSQASRGFLSGGNAVDQSLQPISQIAEKSQKFIEKSLMGRGLTVQRFSAAKPGKNWELNYPYRFLVTRVNKDGRHSVVAEYRLPMNPQDMTTSTPFAIKATVTSQGRLIEHNGAPTRQINLKGTTGIYIEREAGGKEQKRTDVIGTLFGGTLNAVQNATRQLKVAGASLGFGQNPLSSNTEIPQLTRTGYYQFQLLDLFLHTYAETKAAPGNQDIRLIFENTKDNVAYIVEPMNFQKIRTSTSPMEYFYQITLFAWATVPDFKGVGAVPQTSLALSQDVGDLQRMLNTVRDLRKTIKSFQDIVGAVRADIESNIFGPINNVILLAKDILSIPIAIADLPKSLRDSFKSTIAASWQSLSQTNEDLKNLFDSKFQDIIKEGSGSSSFIGSATNGDGPTSIFKSEEFDDIDLTDNVQIDQLQLTDAQQTAVQAAQDDAKDTTVNEVEDLIFELEELSTALEPSIQEKNAQDEEWEILYAISDAVTELYGLIANGNLNSSANEEAQGEQEASLATSALAFWDQTAENSGIDFTPPAGKFSVPFPFGSTLEQLAALYMGDATRWTEIAALNGLQYPYIDEEGFVYNFVGNGSQNQINVESAVNLFVGQSIFISSDTQLTTKRSILSISEVSDTNFLLTVSGASNLNIYRTVDNAQIMAFLPYTVNSLKQIFIPTDVPPSVEEGNTKPITFLNDDIDMIKFSKIDWLVDSYGDLAVTKDGFINLAFGKANLLQAAKTKMITPPGGIILDPAFGAGVTPGDSFADVNLDDLAKRIDESFRNDPRFLSPSKIDLNAAPTVLQADVVAIVSKDNGILPISLPLSK